MADEQQTSKELVEAREGEMADLFSRMDEDRELYYLAEYKMLDLEGQEVPKNKVHNITLNDPALFAYRAIAIISSAHQQTVVEGKGMTDAESSYIEEFLDAVLYEIDVRLGNIGIAGLFPYMSEQANVRGRACARFLFRKVGDILIPDLATWDTRFVSYRNDINGLVWANLRSHRSAEESLREYPTAKEHIQGSSATILDFWKSKKNEVWVEDHRLHARGHNYGMPVIYQIVPAGSMLSDPDAVSHEGESIFALDRKIWPELNKAASVLQTLNMMSFLTPMQYESEAGESATLPDKPPYGVGAVTAVEKGGGFKKMPMEDMRNATRHLLALLEGRAQRGSLPSVDYGNLTFPLSAVAIARLTESKDLIFVPRLQGLAMFYQRLARMIIRQYLSWGMAMEFGEEGNRKKFEPEKLKGSYTIKFRYYSQSPEQTIANYAVGQAAFNIGMSKHTIFTDILKLTNPMGEILKRRSEDAEDLDPVLKLHNTVLALIDDEKYIDARILSDTVVGMIKQRRLQIESPQQAVTQKPQVKGQKRLEGNQLVPLLTEGGGGTRRLGLDELEPDEGAERDTEKRQQMAEINRTRREAESA